MRVNGRRSRVLYGLFAAANHLVRPLLRSRLHPLVSRRLMLLTYEGVASGRTYAIPVGYCRCEPGEVWAFGARAGWASNFRQPRTVRLLLRGQEVRARATVVESPEHVARMVEQLVRHEGPGAVRDPFLGLPRDRHPTHEEALSVADRARAVRFRPVEPSGADGTTDASGTSGTSGASSADGA